MRFLIQRVKRAQVTVKEKIIGEIGKGFAVFIGVEGADTPEIADKMTKKLIGLRIFEDENGKTNLDLKTVGGALLIVSQFTLYADCRKGNRPSFVGAGKPEKANCLYEYFAECCRRHVTKVEQGVFGANMKVELLNDGPFTLLLEGE